MAGREKRKYKRLEIELGLSWRRVGDSAESSRKGLTLNVGPGGLFFETSGSGFGPGAVLDVELDIPPTSGLLEFGGKMSGFGRVLRLEKSPRAGEGGVGVGGRYGVAVEFCRRPRFGA